VCAYLAGRRVFNSAVLKERVMANREQRSNREKRKPKKEKPKGGAAVSSFAVQSSKPPGKAK
jgi:hypothetical protein